MADTGAETEAVVEQQMGLLAIKVVIGTIREREKGFQFNQGSAEVLIREFIAFGIAASKARAFAKWLIIRLVNEAFVDTAGGGAEDDSAPKDGTPPGDDDIPF